MYLSLQNNHGDKMYRAILNTLAEIESVSTK